MDATVHMVSNRRFGLAALRREEFSVVLLEEALAQADDVGVDLLYQNAGSAPLLELNFAISSGPRILRQVRAALARRGQDRAHARRSVAEDLQNELNASLAGLLLESQLMLRDASPELAPKVRHLVQMAGDLRNRLRVHA
jgi:hypothetical protein